MRPDGTEVQNLTQSTSSDIFVSWSPDGEWIIFHCASFDINEIDICRMRPDGTEIQNLTNSPRVDVFQAWSPDGEWMIFGSDRDFDNSRNINYFALDLYRMRPDGSDVQELVRSSGDDRFEAWTPDGEWIIFSSDRNDNNDLFRVRPDGSKQENLTRTLLNDNLAEDPFMGDYLYFEQSIVGSIFRIHLPTGDTEDLTHGDAFYMVWSPEREWIVFHSQRDQTEITDYLILDIFRMRPDGTELENLTHSSEGDFFQSWSPDGEWLIFQSAGSLYRMRVDGTDISPITSNNRLNWFETWSPDGEWLIYRENSSKLFITRLDGSETQQLASSDGDVEFVSWYVEENEIQD